MKDLLDIKTGGGVRFDIAAVLNILAKYYNIEKSIFYTTKSKHQVTAKRDIAIYFLRNNKILPYKTKTIASHFSMSESTVGSLLCKIKVNLKINTILRDELDLVYKHIYKQLGVNDEYKI